MAALVPLLLRYASCTFQKDFKGILHFLSRKLAHYTRHEATIHGDSFCPYLALMRFASSAVFASPDLMSFAWSSERKGRVAVTLMLYMYNADVKVSSFASHYRAERSR